MKVTNALFVKRLKRLRARGGHTQTETILGLKSGAKISIHPPPVGAGEESLRPTAGNWMFVNHSTFNPDSAATPGVRCPLAQPAQASVPAIARQSRHTVSHDPWWCVTEIRQAPLVYCLGRLVFEAATHPRLVGYQATARAG